MSDEDEWNSVTQLQDGEVFGFTVTPQCGSRGRLVCECNVCQVMDMMFSLHCPWCEASCAAEPDERGIALVKGWMGRHLAHEHQNEMERYITWQSKMVTLPVDTSEWVEIRKPSGYNHSIESRTIAR